jgi:hypothetical protein
MLDLIVPDLTLGLLNESFDLPVVLSWGLKKQI